MNNPLSFSWASLPCRCVHGACLPISAFSYSCKCLQGYGGALCEDDGEVFNPCQPLRCKHGQCRLSGLGKPYCECRSGYTGESCNKGEPPVRRDSVSLLEGESPSFYLNSKKVLLFFFLKKKKSCSACTCSNFLSNSIFFLNFLLHLHP